MTTNVVTFAPRLRAKPAMRPARLGNRSFEMSRINQVKMAAIKHSYNHTSDKWFKSNIQLAVEPAAFQEGAMRTAVIIGEAL